MPHYSEAYVRLLKQGPLAGQIDPWAEVGRYFHQIHSGMIDQILGQIRLPLLAMGYYAGRETSLQIAEYRQPDVYVRRKTEAPRQPTAWDYEQAAEVALAEPGILIEGIKGELDAIFIKKVGAGDLVTVVEIISPSNKSDNCLIDEHIARRERLWRQ